MNKVIISVVALIIATLPLSASANPTELDLSFNYKINGTLRLDVKFDKAITSRNCRLTHRSAFYFENDPNTSAQKAKRTNMANRLLKVGAKSTSIRAKGIRGARRQGGEDPIMSVQARLTCGKTIVDSNIEARFMRCGDGDDARLSLSQFIAQLKKKYKDSK